MVVSRCRLLREVLIEMAGRDDVEHRRLCDLVGVVQRHAMHHAAAAVVADGRELVEPEVLHHFDLILGHGALGVAGMVLAAGRLAAVAVAPEVRRHHGIVLGQLRSHERPGDVRLRIAVQQQDRRTLAANHPIDLRARGLYPETFEVSREEVGTAAVGVGPLGFCGRGAGDD